MRSISGAIRNVSDFKNAHCNVKLQRSQQRNPTHYPAVNKPLRHLKGIKVRPFNYRQRLLPRDLPPYPKGIKMRPSGLQR